MQASCRLALLVIVLAVVAPTALAGERLAWKWETGQTLHYRISGDHEMTVRGAPEQRMEAAQSQSLDWRYEVVSVEDGWATVRATCEATRVDIDMGSFGGIEWDSEEPADGSIASHPMIAPFVHLVGQSFTFVVDASGSVREVRGTDAIVRFLEERTRDNPTMEGVGAALEASFGERATQQLLESFLGVVPGSDVEPGTSWTRQTARFVPALGVLRYDSTFRVGDREETPDGSCTVIEVGAELGFAPGSGAEDAEPAETMRMSLEGGSATGGFCFDGRAGRLVRGEVSTRLDMTARVEMPDPGGEGVRDVELRQHVDGTSRIELLPGD